MLLPPPMIVTLSATEPPSHVRHRAALPHPTAQLFIICTGEPTGWFDAVQRIEGA